MHILMIEDTEAVCEMMEMFFENEGWKASFYHDGKEGLDAFLENQNKWGVVILDVNLPSMDGMQICRQIRQVNQNVPIVMLTARDSESDQVIGLEIGADDYVTKPFSNRELQARVKALLRRTELTVESQTESISDSDIVIGDLKIIPDAFLAQKKGKELELTHREFELLYHLATHVGQVMTREHLLETVWGYDYFGDVRTVDVTIRRLREKIEDIPGRPEYILTRRGVGYYMRNND